MKTVIKTSTGSYPVYTGRGLLDDLASYLPENFAGRKVLTITDDSVAPLYLDKVRNAVGTEVFVVKHGEKSKSLSCVGKILEFLAEKEFNRKDAIIALGGGVVGDLAGFVSSIYVRGIPYVQIPTTLLAGIDSSVGGKTAVNLTRGKNMVGRIYPPEAVIFDLETLNTLPKKYLKDGYGEGLKYALLCGEELFAIMEKGVDESNLERFVDLCVRYKADVVEKDENESSLRRLLNLGHTVGHAVERKSSLRYTHGVCVGIGLRVVCRACRKNGFLSENEYRRCITLFDKYRIPENPYPIKDLLDVMRLDKKTDGEYVNLITVHGIGDCRIEKMTFGEAEVFFE